MKALILSDNDFEDREVFYPYYRLLEGGIEVFLASSEEKEIRGKYGIMVKPDLAFEDVKPEDFDVLVIPGGKAPEKVRLNKDALKIVKHFFELRKPVAAICHGPQVLISAGVIKGRRATCFVSVRDDLIAAGARYEDLSVVVDGNLITSRAPPDLPDFARELMKKLKE